MADRRMIIFCLCGLVISSSACSFAEAAEFVETANNWECIEGAGPLQRLEVWIDPELGEQLARQTKDFADLHGYSHRVTQYTPDGQNFRVVMHKPGVLVTVDTPFTPGEFRIGFYNQDCDHPTTAEDLQEDLRDLINLLEEIPGIEIVESN